MGPGKAHHLQFPGDFTQHDLSLQQNSPIPAISPVLSQAQGRQMELVSVSPEELTFTLLSFGICFQKTLKHLPDI